MKNNDIANINELGKRIVKECDRLQITLPYLAEIAKINYRTLHHNITKKNANPTINLIKKISISLGVSTDYLIFGEEKNEEIINLAKEIETLTDEEDKKRIAYMLRMMIAESKLRK